MPNFKKQLANRVCAARKSFYQAISSRNETGKQIVFIFGCQRSGTSMFTQLFRRDLDSKIYGQRGLGRNRSLRMRPLDEVREVVRNERAALQIAKALPESQRVGEILEFFPNARAIWMYRDFRDVARSNHRRFGNEVAMKNLLSIIDPKAEQTFAGERASKKTREVVAEMIAREPRDLEVHCLYWYTRNVLFFEQNLDDNEQVRLLRYEDIVSDPSGTMRSVYEFLGRDYPGDHLVKEVHTRSVGKGADIDPGDQIDALCRNLLDRLDGRPRLRQ